MPSSRDWILVLFGRFVRSSTSAGSTTRDVSWIATAHLVALADALGSDPASTRTAIHRMKRAGFVDSERRGDVAGYRLTSVGEDFFADGDRRVMDHDAGADGDERWLLVSFSVPESQRRVRYRLRSGLLDIGFGQVSPGLLMAPRWLKPETERFIEREGVGRWVSLWDGTYDGPGRLHEIVSATWNLDALRGRYLDYLATTQAVLAADPAGDREAFVAFANNVNSWRELRYTDPVLPASSLPLDWPAVSAREAFDAVDRRLSPAAIRYFDAVGRRGREVAA